MMKNILILDDHKLIYEGLKSQFPPNINLKYSSSLMEARYILEREFFDALIIDINLKKENGFDLVEYIPVSIPFFFLSMYNSFFYVNKARELGAGGYFLKDEPVEYLIKAVSSTRKEGFILSPSLRVLNHPQNQPPSVYDSLTAREQQIFLMLAEGKNYKEIAYRLNISAKTVNNHRANIMKKLTLSNQSELVKEALKIGIITLD